MEIPKPSFLRKPSIPDFPLPKPDLSHNKVPGRLMTLKDLRKTRKIPASSSFSSVLSSPSRLPDLSRLLATQRTEKRKGRSRSGLYSVHLVRFQGHSRLERQLKVESLCGVTGHKVPISPTRVVIQIARKLPHNRL